MSGKRDRLGLLLPIPALLAVEPGAAQAEGAGDAMLDGRGAAAEALDGPDIGPCLSPPMPDEPPVGPCLTPMHEDPPPAETEEPAELPSDPTIEAPAQWSEAPPTEADAQVRTLFGRAREALVEARYRDAAELLEQAAGLAPDLVTLRLDATIAYRFAATDEQDPDRASELCSATRRNAEAVMGYPGVAEAMAERARAESVRADEHCTMLMDTAYGPCLSPETGPCLSMLPPAQGCASRRNDPLAMLGGLMLLGLRTRRRRDAIERMADRLPPDVAAKLRRNDDESDEQ